MTQIKTVRKLIGATTLLAATTFMVGCGGSSSDGGGASLGSFTISGSLSSGSSKVGQSKVGAKAVNVSDLELYGLAFSNPPEVKTVALGSDGSFSLEFSEAAKNASITLVFRSKSDPSNEVGVVKFEDSSKKDLSGNTKKQSSIALSGSVNLGSLAVNESGEVVVPISNIQSSDGAGGVAAGPTGDVFDFSGNWQVAAYDGTLPSGYSNVCQPGDMNCHGPQAGENLHIERLVGKEFTPDTTCQSAVDGETFDPSTDTCNGTTGTANVYGIRVWAGEAAKTTCGEALGIDYEEAKAFAGVDLSNSGISEGAFNWSITDGTNSITDGWKVANAQTQWPIHNCYSTTVTINSVQYDAHKCVDGSARTAINLNSGGCTDGSGNKVHVTGDWGALTPDSCSSSAFGTDGSGNSYQEHSCDYSNADHDGDGATAAISFTCKHVNYEEASFDWATTQIADSGVACSTLGSNPLEQLKCYADAYYQSNLRQDPNLCVREIETDWAAQTAADFIINEGPPRPATLFVFELFNYAPDGQAGSFGSEEVFMQEVDGLNGNPVACKVAEAFQMSIKTVSATQMIGEMTQKVRLLDTDKEACVAEASKDNSRLGVGISKSIMYFNKQ